MPLLLTFSAVLLISWVWCKGVHWIVGLYAGCFDDFSLLEIFLGMLLFHIFAYAFVYTMSSLDRQPVPLNQLELKILALSLVEPLASHLPVLQFVTGYLKYYPLFSFVMTTTLCLLLIYFTSLILHLLIQVTTRGTASLRSTFLFYNNLRSAPLSIFWAISVLSAGVFGERGDALWFALAIVLVVFYFRVDDTIFLSNVRQV